MTKICTKCLQEKPESEFYPRIKRCKACRVATVRAYQEHARAQRMCEVCHEPYVPRMSKQRTCSLKCGGELRQGRKLGGAKHRHVRSGAVGDRDPCRCSSCAAGRVSDRSALIAKVAAEMGLPVSPEAQQPRKKMTPMEWVRHCEKVRDGMRSRDRFITARIVAG